MGKKILLLLLPLGHFTIVHIASILVMGNRIGRLRMLNLEGQVRVTPQWLMASGFSQLQQTCKTKTDILGTT